MPICSVMLPSIAPTTSRDLDITYVLMSSGWMYLVAVLDRFSRFVVSWAVDEIMELLFALAAAWCALVHATPAIGNGDQGSQFTSPKYTQLLLESRVQIGMDGKGRSLDNIFTERLWHKVKYEHPYLQDYGTLRAVRMGPGKYFEFYNYQQLNLALEYRTLA